MNVHVEYTAQLKRAAGVSRETLEVRSPCTLPMLIDAIVNRHGDELGRMLKTADGTPQTTIVPFIGDEQVRWDSETELHEGASVTLLAPISGG